MALTSFPFENQDTTEAQFSRLFRELQDDGVAGDHGDTAFAVTADGSGLDVQIAPGFAFVRGHVVQSTASETLVLASANTSPRIDRVVLRLDPAANTITLAVKTGTPSSTPEAPPLTLTDTGNYEVLLAEVNVPASALNISNTNIVDRRNYAGQRTGVWTTASRPLVGLTKKGKLGFNRDTGLWEYFDGVTFKDLMPPPSAKKIRIPHTFTVSGDVRVASGDDAYIPPFFVPVPANQTVRLVGTKVRLNSGGSVNFQLTKNGAGIYGPTTATTTASNPGGTDVSFADGDALACVVTSISGTPRNLTVTCYFDYTV
jgi:hypothetical protein